jgi:hypothetical protein
MMKKFSNITGQKVTEEPKKEVKQLNEEEQNHYKIATFEAFLNYVKYNMDEANQTVDIQMDRESLKEKLVLKFKKTPQKINELINQYDIISSRKNNFDVYLICNNCNSSYTINSKSIIFGLKNSYFPGFFSQILY